MRRIINSSRRRLERIIPEDTAIFLKQFIRHPTDIGALTPSSAHLADAMTRFVTHEPADKKGKTYLEAGAGTGAFTKAIVQKMRPIDRLDIIEINPVFCERLKTKYAGFKNISIHTGSVLEWKPSYQYDTIVSSLPFNAFPAEFVTEIYENYLKICKSGGYLSYCEYMVLPGIRKMFLKPSSRRALQATLDVTYQFEKIHEICVDKVFVNFPPALVHHCKLG